MQEVWKDVVGFEEYFKVSKYGAVFSKRSGRILKQTMNKEGYYAIATKIGGRDGTHHCLKVHRMVAEAFLEPPSEELKSECKSKGRGVVIVRHLNNDKTDNVASNLAWGTYKDNSADFKSTEEFGIRLAKVSGHNNVFAKATPEVVDAIRKRYIPRCSVNGARALADEYGIHHTNISKICRGVAYK